MRGGSGETVLRPAGSVGRREGIVVSQMALVSLPTLGSLQARPCSQLALGLTSGDLSYPTGIFVLSAWLLHTGSHGLCIWSPLHAQAPWWTLPPSSEPGRDGVLCVIWVVLGSLLGRVTALPGV